MNHDHLHSVLAAVAAALLGVLCACSEQEAGPGTLLNQAADKAAEGNWAAADQLAAGALKQKKDDPDALMLLALARNSLDARDEAVSYAIQAARLKPDSFTAQYIQGMLLSSNGKPDLALKALKDALRLRPDDVNTLILLVENSIAARRYSDAAQYLKILARNPAYQKTSYVWNGLGTCYAVSAPEMALRYFRMAETLLPNDPVAALNLAVLYDTRLGRSPQARADWAKRTGNDPAGFEKECSLMAQRYYTRFLRMTERKTEYDTIRSQAAARLDGLRGR